MEARMSCVIYEKDNLRTLKLEYPGDCSLSRLIEEWQIISVMIIPLLIIIIHMTNKRSSLLYIVRILVELSRSTTINQ